MTKKKTQKPKRAQKPKAKKKQEKKLPAAKEDVKALVFTKANMSTIAFCDSKTSARKALQHLWFIAGKSIVTNGIMLITIQSREPIDSTEVFAIDQERAETLLKLMNSNNSCRAVIHGESVEFHFQNKYNTVDIITAQRMEKDLKFPGNWQELMPKEIHHKVRFKVQLLHSLLKYLLRNGADHIDLSFPAEAKTPVRFDIDFPSMQKGYGLIMPMTIENATE